MTVGSEVIWAGLQDREREPSCGRCCISGPFCSPRFFYKSDILKNSESRCPAMVVAVLSGTARTGLSPHGLRRAREPTLCGPSPPRSTTRPAGGTAPRCSAGVSGRAPSESPFRRLRACRTDPLQPRGTSSGWPDARGAGLGGGSGRAMGGGGRRPRPSWRRGRPGC